MLKVLKSIFIKRVIRTNIDSIERNEISPKERLFVLSFVLLSIIIRFYFALNKNIIFIDEGSIIDRISKDFLSNLRTFKHNENIYPQVLWLIFHGLNIDFLIDNPFIIRIPSILIFSFSIYLFYIVSRRLFDFQTSLFCTILNVFSIFLIDVSFEPRGYILGFFFLLLSALSSGFYSSLIFFVLASISHVSCFFYLPFIISLRIIDGRMDVKRAVYFVILGFLFSFATQLIYLFFGEQFFLKLTPRAKENFFSVIHSSFYSFSGGKFSFFVMMGLFFVGFWKMDLRKKIFISSGIVTYFLILLSEKSNPVFGYFLVKHTFLSCMFFYLCVSYGVVNLLNIFGNNFIKFLAFSFLALLWGTINLSSKYLWVKFSLSSPFLVKDLIERNSQKVRSFLIYFDPLFITKGVGTLFFQFSVKRYNAKILIDKNFSYFLKFSGKNPILETHWVYVDDLISNKGDLKLLVFLPTTLPEYYDELNMIEWWIGDYERDFKITAERLRKIIKEKYGIDVDYDVGIFAFEYNLNQNNFITEIEILRDLVSEFYLHFFSIYYRDPKEERISSQ